MRLRKWKGILEFLNELRVAVGNVKKQVNLRIRESASRLKFLEQQKDLTLDTVADSTSNPFHFILKDYPLKQESVKHSLERMKRKLMMEIRFISGCDNLASAINAGNTTQLKVLKQELNLAKGKYRILKSSSRKLSQLSIITPDIKEPLNIADRFNGIFKILLTDVQNLEEFTDGEKICIVNFDGREVYRTSKSTDLWNSAFEKLIEGVEEVEFCIISKGRIVAFQWFRIKDLSKYLDEVYPRRPGNISSFNPIVINLIPSGELTIKMDFQKTTDSMPANTSNIYRKDGVEKVYPQNGHLFVSKPLGRSASMKCAFCNEFLQWSMFSCERCSYTIHQGCYLRVITTCINSPSQFVNHPN